MPRHTFYHVRRRQQAQLAAKFNSSRGPRTVPFCWLPASRLSWQQNLIRPVDLGRSPSAGSLSGNSVLDDSMSDLSFVGVSASGTSGNGRERRYFSVGGGSGSGSSGSSSTMRRSPQVRSCEDLPPDVVQTKG